VASINENNDGIQLKRRRKKNFEKRKKRRKSGGAEMTIG